LYTLAFRWVFIYIEQIDYDPTTHRIHCLDHILNFALQAFLLATSKEALKAALAAIEETEDTDPYELFSAYLDVPVVEDNPASIRAHEQAQRRRGKLKRSIKVSKAGVLLLRSRSFIT
jgi:hypothetical protein